MPWGTAAPAFGPAHPGWPPHWHPHCISVQCPGPGTNLTPEHLWLCPSFIPVPTKTQFDFDLFVATTYCKGSVNLTGGKKIEYLYFHYSLTDIYNTPVNCELRHNLGIMHQQFLWLGRQQQSHMFPYHTKLAASISNTTYTHCYSETMVAVRFSGSYLKYW